MSAGQSHSGGFNSLPNIMVTSNKISSNATRASLWEVKLPTSMAMATSSSQSDIYGGSDTMRTPAWDSYQQSSSVNHYASLIHSTSLVGSVSKLGPSVGFSSAGSGNAHGFTQNIPDNNHNNNNFTPMLPRITDAHGSIDLSNGYEFDCKDTVKLFKDDSANATISGRLLGEVKLQLYCLAPEFPVFENTNAKLGFFYESHIITEQYLSEKNRFALTSTHAQNVIQSFSGNSSRLSLDTTVPSPQNTTNPHGSYYTPTNASAHNASLITPINASTAATGSTKNTSTRFSFFGSNEPVTPVTHQSVMAKEAELKQLAAQRAHIKQIIKEFEKSSAEDAKQQLKDAKKREKNLVKEFDDLEKQLKKDRKELAKTTQLTHQLSSSSTHGSDADIKHSVPTPRSPAYITKNRSRFPFFLSTKIQEVAIGATPPSPFPPHTSRTSMGTITPSLRSHRFSKSGIAMSTPRGPSTTIPTHSLGNINMNSPRFQRQIKNANITLDAILSNTSSLHLFHLYCAESHTSENLSFFKDVHVLYSLYSDICRLRQHELAQIVDRSECLLHNEEKSDKSTISICCFYMIQYFCFLAGCMFEEYISDRGPTQVNLPNKLSSNLEHAMCLLLTANHSINTKIEETRIELLNEINLQTQSSFVSPSNSNTLNISPKMNAALTTGTDSMFFPMNNTIHKPNNFLFQALPEEDGEFEGPNTPTANTNHNDEGEAVVPKDSEIHVIDPNSYLIEAEMQTAFILSQVPIEFDTEQGQHIERLMEAYLVALEEILSLLNRDIYPRFKESTFYPQVVCQIFSGGLTKLAQSAPLPEHDVTKNDESKDASNILSHTTINQMLSPSVMSNNIDPVAASAKRKQVSSIKQLQTNYFKLRMQGRGSHDLLSTPQPQSSTGLNTRTIKIHSTTPAQPKMQISIAETAENNHETPQVISPAHAIKPLSTAPHGTPIVIKTPRLYSTIATPRSRRPAQRTVAIHRSTSRPPTRMAPTDLICPERIENANDNDIGKSNTNFALAPLNEDKVIISSSPITHLHVISSMNDSPQPIRPIYDLSTPVNNKQSLGSQSTPTTTPRPVQRSMLASTATPRFTSPFMKSQVESINTTHVPFEDFLASHQFQLKDPILPVSFNDPKSPRLLSKYINDYPPPTTTVTHLSTPLPKSPPGSMQTRRAVAPTSTITGGIRRKKQRFSFGKNSPSQNNTHAAHNRGVSPRVPTAIPTPIIKPNNCNEGNIYQLACDPVSNDFQGFDPINELPLLPQPSIEVIPLLSTTSSHVSARTRRRSSQKLRKSGHGAVYHDDDNDDSVTYAVRPPRNLQPVYYNIQSSSPQLRPPTPTKESQNNTNTESSLHHNIDQMALYHASPTIIHHSNTNNTVDNYNQLDNDHLHTDELCPSDTDSNAKSHVSSFRLDSPSASASDEIQILNINGGGDSKGGLATFNLKSPQDGTKVGEMYRNMMSNFRRPSSLAPPPSSCAANISLLNPAALSSNSSSNLLGSSSQHSLHLSISISFVKNESNMSVIHNSNNDISEISDNLISSSSTHLLVPQHGADEQPQSTKKYPLRMSDENNIQDKLMSDIATDTPIHFSMLSTPLNKTSQSNNNSNGNSHDDVATTKQTMLFNKFQAFRAQHINNNPAPNQTKKYDHEQLKRKWFGE